MLLCLCTLFCLDINEHYCYSDFMGILRNFVEVDVLPTFRSLMLDASLSEFC